MDMNVVPRWGAEGGSKEEKRLSDVLTDAPPMDRWMNSRNWRYHSDLSQLLPPIPTIRINGVLIRATRTPP